jgi:HD-GYP domain-containing protein (c-di-GMP phosphodiesterase class II)
MQWERWDGKGLAYGLKGEDVPIASRILHPAQMLELTYGFSGPEAAIALARERSGTRFDPEVADAFLSLAVRGDLWREMEQDSAQAAILALRPATPADHIGEAQTEAVCEALADFVDIKTQQTLRHSQAVADVAVGVGRALGLSAAEQARLRRAALVHDIGKVAVPHGILAKEGRSAAEWEQYRLHPYYTQRVLDRVAPLQELSEDAAAHHEWANGQGYHRQLRREQITLNGRILAVANAYAGGSRRQDGHEDPEEVLSRMRPAVGTQFDPSCYEGLVASLNGTVRVAKAPPRRRGTTELTEREVEVLGLLTQGLSNPQIARTLVVSRKTVEHHLEHIYGKLGVTCRTAAVAYAVQQRLS